MRAAPSAVPASAVSTHHQFVFTLTDKGAALVFSQNSSSPTANRTHSPGSALTLRATTVLGPRRPRISVASRVAKAFMS